jgi:hypothetical protein
MAVALGLCLLGCSSDQSSDILGSSGRLDRKDHGAEHLLDDPNLTKCELTANDIFGVGGMPFELTCENMAAADHVILSQTYNDAGCLVEQQGEVDFTDTGHAYSYRAVTNGCPHDGGSLTVCSRYLGGCRTANLPRLYNSNADVLNSPPK